MARLARRPPPAAHQTPETEARLLTVARGGTATHVEKVARAWRRVDRNAENRQAEQQHQSRSLSLCQDDDGMVVIRGRLTPEVGALVRQAITAATDRLYAGSQQKPPGECAPTTGQVQADTTTSIPALRVGATRWSSTSTLPC